MIFLVLKLSEQFVKRSNIMLFSQTIMTIIYQLFKHNCNKCKIMDKIKYTSCYFYNNLNVRISIHLVQKVKRCCNIFRILKRRQMHSLLEQD